MLRSRIIGGRMKSQSSNSLSGNHLRNPQFMHLVVWLDCVFTFGVPQRTAMQYEENVPQQDFFFSP